MDPDRKAIAKDKLRHFVGGFGTCAAFDIALSNGQALGATVLAGLIWEGGQTDTAHSDGQLGKPGYGIGILDLCADTLGAVVWLLFKALARGFLGL